MGAIRYIQDDAEGERGAALAEARRTRGYLSNFHRTLANLPPVLRAFEQFSASVRESTPDPALRELIILRVAVLLQNEYEWRRHSVAGLNAGLSDAHLRDLADWPSSEVYNETERAALQLVDAHVRDNDVSPAIVERVRELVGDEGVVHACVTIGWYLFVGAVLLPLRLLEDDTADAAPISMPTL